MALAEHSPFPRISRDPRVHGGEPVIRGTRVPVRVLVVAWRAEPNIEVMLQSYPRLTADDVREALDYSGDHRADLDARIDAQLAGA